MNSTQRPLRMPGDSAKPVLRTMANGFWLVIDGDMTLNFLAGLNRFGMR